MDVSGRYAYILTTQGLYQLAKVGQGRDIRDIRRRRGVLFTLVVTSLAEEFLGCSSALNIDVSRLVRTRYLHAKLGYARLDVFDA
jgi:hypothetical protein